jgi:hypothetical protein
VSSASRKFCLQASIPSKKARPEAAGARLESFWPDAATLCVKQTVRRCIAQRQTVETQFECSDIGYELRAFAQGPDRTLCVIRVRAVGPAAEGSSPSDEVVRPQFDRRGFLGRLNDTLSQAAIREKAAALAVNVSGKELLYGDPARLIEDEAAAANVPPSMIEVEITESLPVKEWLRRRGCHEALGFLLSRPLTVDALTRRLLLPASHQWDALADSNHHGARDLVVPRLLACVECNPEEAKADHRQGQKAP